MTAMTDLSLLALVASADDSTSTGGSLFSYALLPLMFVAFYFLIIRPNSKKRKQAAALQAELGVDDVVMTTSGIVGTIKGEDGPSRFWLEIDDENEILVRIARAAISGRIDDLDGDGDDDVSTHDDEVERDDATSAERD